RYQQYFLILIILVKMRAKITIFNLLVLIISSNTFSQNIDFKLIKAIKTNELLLDRNLDNELVDVVDILPDDKVYLIITAEINNTSESIIKLKRDDVTIGEDKQKVLGYLKLTGRGYLRWGFEGDLFDGKNFFTSIFVVDSKITSTTIDIKGQSFSIPKIQEASPQLECLPKVTVNKKEYLNELSFTDKYRKANNQFYTKKIIPRNGKLLKISLSLEFCENSEFFKRKSFHFEPTFFQLESLNGKLHNCIGTFSFGKYSETSTFNILGKDKLETDIVLIFNVPNEDNYTIKYLNEKVSKI
ncbi:hypothetical protein, partial [Spongiimicrobium salis]|uniref:hypothetical protein n=1 Tax=Spongiimicrobium salis TaxID=1667022 RepID=UPI00374D003E